MSEQNELTYILGAGASFQSIPVVNTFSERFNDFSDFLNVFRRSNHSFYIHDSTIRTQIQNLQYQIIEVYNEFKNHQSFDTYFKKLFHTNQPELINKTKKILNIYFLWEHSKLSTIKFQSAAQNFEEKGDKFNKQTQLDKRYDALLAGLLKPNKDKLEMFCKTNFITWNYDINLLASLKNYFSPESTFDEFLFEITPDKENEFIWELKSAGIKVVNMNGFFYSGIYGIKRSLNELEIKDSFSEINSYLLGVFDKLDHLKIKFAWETNINIGFEAKKIIENSENVIIIGYTFPLYNRLVDMQYMDRVLINGRNLFIQDPRANEICLNLEESFDIFLKDKVKPIENCKSFYVPSIVYNPDLNKSGQYSFV